MNEGDYMTYVWLALMVITIVVEASTVQLVSIWFSVGSFAALLVSIFTEDNSVSVLIQVIVFVVGSLLALVLTRPIVRKMTKVKMQPTNADRVIGTVAIVTSEIDNIAGRGEVNSKGVIWTARSANEAKIPVGANVNIDRIDGNKLIVSIN